jgi:signal transduction histidine kinase/CheY-like chemotaxis protein
MTLRILHLEDNPDDVELVRIALARGGVECKIDPVSTRDSYLSALNRQAYDVILSDSGVPGYDGSAAMIAAHKTCPRVPFIVVSGSVNADPHAPPPTDHASARIAKTELGRLAPTIDQELRRLEFVSREELQREFYISGMQRLIKVLQELSAARDLPSVMQIVRTAARKLVGADAATFVLREGDRCFYADEDAAALLWKGQRLPMSACIAGWTMLNSRPAIIRDVYQDARIEHDWYRPTFVKSLIMMPIRSAAPVGAIGVYWAKTHEATKEEVDLLFALADNTSAAIESVRLIANLERRVAEKSSELHHRSVEFEMLNRELEAFSYSVAHDLRSPLNAIDGFSRALLESCRDSIDGDALDRITRITNSVERMHALISDLLRLSNIVLAPMNSASVDLSAFARGVARNLQAGAPDRDLEVVVADAMIADGDPGLLHIVLENLLSNAWKFTSKTQSARIEVGSETDAAGKTGYFVRDNGAGFDSHSASKLFAPFQRQHAQSQFPGTGVGLATVQRIVHRHGGKIWADAAVNRGACFHFTLGDPPHTE